MTSRRSVTAAAGLWALLSLSAAAAPPLELRPHCEAAVAARLRARRAQHQAQAERLGGGRVGCLDQDGGECCLNNESADAQIQACAVTLCANPRRRPPWPFGGPAPTTWTRRGLQ